MLALALAGLALAATPQELHAQGLALAKAGDAAGAEAAFRSCVQADASYAPCHWELGWIRWAKRDWPAVVAAWKAVARLEPDNAEVPRFLPQAEAQVASAAAAKARLAAAKARPPLPPDHRLTLRAVGDLMIGSDFPQPLFPPGGAAHVFDRVADLLRGAPVTFGNIEGPLCDGGSTHKCKPGQNCYAFRSPTAFASIYRDAGFDLVSTANNHAEDFGLECRLQTEQALGRVGLAFSGRPGTVATVEVDGAKVGMIGFHTNPNSHDVNDAAAAALLVRSVAADHDYVVVSFHGGAEGSKAQHVPDEHEIFYGEDRGHLRAFARTVIGAGADLVIGHGPHVLRGLELVDGHLVMYSLGNFATFGRFNLSGPLGISAVVEATLSPDGRLVSGRILPVVQEGDGVPVPDPAGQSIRLFRELSTADFGERAPLIAQDGTFRPR